MRGKDVRLRGVQVNFGRQVAVRPTDLDIRAGEFFSILGPSGCGKTTLLRAIAGFLEPAAGRVQIGGADMTDIGPDRRPTALIFQHLALFPLMTVAENVGFGLEARGVDRATRERRVAELLAMVDLEGFGSRKPGQLSGGQRQRVAIARALAVEPEVLLLDEPLAALDPTLRRQMREELKALQRRTGVTFVYITHDQAEALALSDRIAVMHAGRILQVDTPDRLYSHPATPFVAGFVGEQNRYEGRVQAVDGPIATVETRLGAVRGRLADPLAPGDAAVVMMRPERIGFASDHPAANRFEAALKSRMLEGHTISYRFEVAGADMLVHVPNAGPGGALLASIHAIAIEPEDVMVFRPEEAALG